MSSRRRHGKRFLIIAVVFVLCASYVAYAVTRPLAALQATAVIIPAKPAKAVSLAWPSYGGEAVGTVGYGVLTVNGAEKPLPTASIAKVMTALAVLQQKPLAL